ncbi:uncharacterized protein [Eurosta solidaginis]|uniref:uncharacterized protein n=1 Tax=Eurosta solidaginis TaxID=178769 RepID=UPI0035312F4F
MEATPKVHHHRHRRSDSRHHRHERQSNNSSSNSNGNTNTSGGSNNNAQQQRQNNMVTTTEITTTITSATPTTMGALAANAITMPMQLQQSPTLEPTHSNAFQSPVRERRGQARINRALSSIVGNGATADAAASTTGAAVNVNSTTIENPTALTHLADEEGVDIDELADNSIFGVSEDISASLSVITVHERQTLDPLTKASQSNSNKQTVLLVNGHAPPPQECDEQITRDNARTANTDFDGGRGGGTAMKDEGTTQLESPTSPNPNGGGASSSRNSSGDALSLRETLQQLPPTITHGHRHRRTHSPQSPARRTQEVDASFHCGILGFMDRELKHSSPTPSALSVGSGSAASGGGGSGGASGTVRKLQSLSDPQASPAQRSVRSRSSLDKSPRRKRSKSESRRRRERKLIAAGEMEVRQANETLMRYLKQCSEMNDASLSGELEIDQSYDERRVHRKTKSQRDKRGHLISKLYSAGGLSSILRELSDDIVPAEGEEIYNPFTPVVSPSEDTPAHIDKMFLQTSSGYRPVEHCYYKHSFVGVEGASGGSGGCSGGGGKGGTIGASASGRFGLVGGVAHRLSAAGGSLAGGLEHAGILRASGSFGDTRCLLDAECGRHRREITSNIELACVIQRIWILISNICHGLLAGLALAHLLFVLSSHPLDWSRVLSFAGETVSKANDANMATAITMASDGSNSDGADKLSLTGSQHTFRFLEDYATFADIYLNTFYCLAIICMVSVFDRMDICRWDFSNATKFVSFRWLIIAMIYIATILLTICSDSIDARLCYSNNANVTLTQEEMYSNSVLSVWSSLSVTRSIGAICGWIMIGLTPNEDLLYEHLLDLTKFQVTNN